MSQRTYQAGIEFAQEVQKALANGKTFDDMDAFTPEEAVRIRELYANIDEQDTADLLAGYLSRWD